MADVNANIDINIDSSNALAQLKSLQRQISQFHTSIAKSSEAAALAQRGLQKNLLNSINAIGAFTAEMRTVKTSAESFTDSLEKNKFSMREYFRYAGASTKTFGRLFRSEFDTIEKVAEERVKRLQTQYIKMGRDTNGAMKAISIMPTELNMSDYTTQVQMAAQKQALFNQLMKQGSTNLLNFGKNTQWAGRQLMVGFTLPLMAVGAAATKTFMEMEAQALRFRKVYGDLFTPQEETQAALENITELGRQFTKYGVAVSTTVGLASEAAAAGFSGLDLQRQTTQATRLSILGQVDSQKALETTISLQNAFGMSSENLADSINFLNAVENQTVVSLDDITTAIPKVAPVIQQLGGDVKDLAFFMAAMKEGGINASEGANALKSGLAALINPTKKASEMLASYGINANAIVEKNKGDLKATVIGFAQALNQLDPLARARAIEQMFGKFQFARLSTLFANVAKDGNQAARVLDLANSSVEDLAALSEKELGMTAESSMNKFKKSVEDLKIALVPVGQAFLEAVTPIVEFVGNILEKFANLSDGTKKVITLLTVGIGAVGPVLLMTFGLLANGIANIIKLFLTLRGGYQRLTGQSQILGEQTQYMTMEQLDAAAAAHSLNQTHANLTQTFTAEASAVNQLINAYNSAAGAARNFAANNPRMMMPARGARKLANGIVSVPGSGKGDTVPAMLTPGEAVIPTELAKKYAPLIQGMIADNIPGYRTGRIGSGFSGRVGKSGTTVVRPYLENVSNTSGLVNFEDINPSDLADVASIYVKEIMAKAKISATAIAREMDLWKANNIAAINAATAAVDSGQSAADAFGPLAEKFKIDMEASGGAVHKFNITATEMMPELQKDLITAQTKAKELSLNIKKAADATALAEALPQNILAKGIATPGPYGSRSKARQAAVLGQTGAAGIGTYGIPRFMLPVNVDPQSMSSKLSTSQEHFSTTKIQEANLATQAKLREQAKTDAKAYKKGTEEAGLTDLYVVSQDRQSPHRFAAQDGKDDANAYTGAVDTTVRKNSRRATRPQGPAPRSGVPFADPAILGMAYQENAMRDKVRNQARSMQVANIRMDKLNKAFMSGTFALSALSGVASMAGGNLGKFSEILFQISGPMFALSSILQLFTGKKILSLLTALGGLKLGLIAVAITALGVGIKLTNDARKRELEYINGLSDAMKTTTEQVKTLGDFFGVVPTKLPFENRNREIVRRETRSARDTLRADASFQKQFGPTIKTLSKSTAQEAQLAFTSLALNLKAQGFATEQVQTIVDALREEAGKTNVKLDVKSLNFSPESIKSLQDQISGLLVSFSRDFSVKPTSGQKFLGGFIGSLLGSPAQVMEMTNATKKSLSELTTFITETSNSAAGMFRLGLISGEEFESSLMSTVNTMQGLDEASRRVALLEIFKKLDVNAAPFLKNLQTAKQEMMLIALLSSGVLGKDSPILKALSSTDSKTQSRGINGLRIAYENLFGAIAKVNEEDAKGDQGPTGEGKLNALQEKIKAIKQQTQAYIILRNAKIDEATATELSNDAEIASLIIANSKGKSLKQIIALVKEYKKALADQTKAEFQYMSGPNLFKKQLERSKAEAALREKLIDMQFAPQIKKENDALAIQEKRLSDINTQIEKVTRSQVEPIQAVIDSNNLALEKIALQEDSINEKYNKQIEALDKISSINQDIANIQRQRLSIADALTRGDISTAAQLMQDARAEQAQSAAGGQKDSLTATRDAAIAALGRNAIEKQNKELQLQINIIEATQLKTLEAQKQTIEDTITSINANITALNNQVTVAKEGALYSGKTKQDIDDLDELIAKATEAGIPFTEQLLKQAGSAQALAAALASALATQKQLGSGATTIDEIKAGAKAGTITAQTITPEQKAVVLQSIKDLNAKIQPQIKKLQSTIKGKALGGMVTKYMANGGAVGSDTVPAMLTPGEFIVNKAAAKAYGPMLSSINESKYPSMLGSSSGMSNLPINNISASVSDNSTAVYNYSLGFNINGTNSNPSDIARAVMTEIKRVDAQRIRGQR